MENKNGNNNDHIIEQNEKTNNNVFYTVDKKSMSQQIDKISELDLIWNKLLEISKDVQKKDLIIKYCDLLSKYINYELKDNKLNLKKSDCLVLNYFKKNIVVEKITNFIITCPDNREIFILYSSHFLNLLKYKEEFIKDNKLLKKSIFKAIIHLFEELKKNKIKFKLKNEFSLFLNVVTRILLNYPDFIPFFKVRKENIYTHNQYDDYFIFSSLLALIEIDDTIQELEYKKYIRRSLIVYLSFDEITNSYYLQKKIIFVEMIINKLCNYYQMLPDSFEFAKTTGTLEVGCNLHYNFQSLCPKYFDFVDYISFLNKISNCLSGNIKQKFKYYFFNKFLINTVQSFILSPNLKISRTHFQYIVTILYFSKSEIIVDDITYFLFGFKETPYERKFSIISENSNNIHLNKMYKKVKKNRMNFEKVIVEFDSMTENYLYRRHRDNDIFYLIIKNLLQTKEYINIITYELFEILFELRPFLMIKKFVKPYADYAFKQIKLNSIKYKIKSVNKYKSYPITIQLIKLYNYYKQFDTRNISHNFQSSAHKNFAFYINNNIDFYLNFLNQKKDEEENEKFMNSTQVSTNSYSYNTNTSFYSIKENYSLIDKLSVDNLLSGTFEEEEYYTKNIKTEKDIIEHDFIFIDKNLFNDEASVDEGIHNMNFLFMKYLYKKMLNFFKNTTIENIFLTNLLLTILSVPCLNFDCDLVKCNSIILDDDSDSKYSFLTLFRFLCQEILSKFQTIQNIDKLKKFIQIIIGKGEKEENVKNDFVFKGFLKMKYNEKNKDKIEVLNFIIFCEFIKEYIASISYKHKFESTIENLYNFYSEELEKNEI